MVNKMKKKRISKCGARLNNKIDKIVKEVLEELNSLSPEDLKNEILYRDIEETEDTPPIIKSC